MDWQDTFNLSYLRKIDIDIWGTSANSLKEKVKAILRRLTFVSILIALEASLFSISDAPYYQDLWKSAFFVQVFCLIMIIFWQIHFKYLRSRLLGQLQKEAPLIVRFLFYLVCGLSQCSFVLSFTLGSSSEHSSYLATTALTCAGFVIILLSFLIPAEIGLYLIGMFFPKNRKDLLPKIRFYVTYTTLIIALILTTIGVFNAIQPPVVERVPVKLERLPEACSGLQIAQITDVHIGPTVGKNFVRWLVNAVNSLEADIIVMTGDIVDGNPSRYSESAALLGNLKAPKGVYYVNGNHEHIHRVADHWANAFSELGIIPLRNSRVDIDCGGRFRSEDTFDLAGVEDWTARHDLSKALKDRNGSRELVLLAHQPKMMIEAIKRGVGLQISGHTHAGQFWPGHIGAYFGNPFFAGLYSIAAPVSTRKKTSERRPSVSQIYVSAGTRYWGPPLRLWSQPEITLFTLTKP
eukprot:TRINITY_DN9857_c0_g1_i1.p1 TRINITY_DN9857_c0_g1~~TRINITY_DN9857_c0_g1_i1.p1  ORF type:complete len:464 (+),score=51.80 TRINITY_DN9857_c0_g1_i1:59-1450(+)